MSEVEAWNLPELTSPTGTERIHAQGADPNDYFVTIDRIATHAQVGMATDAELSAHASDTTSVHGIADTSALLDTSDIGVSVQGYSAVLAGTTASFTTADETKLDGIEAGADVTDAANVASAGAVMASLADAKGDLFVATAADTVARLAVGTNGYVLTADSAESAGVKWAATAGGGVGTRHWVNSGGGAYWLFPGCATRTTRSDSMSANQTYHTPWVITEECTLEALAITVQTSGVGNARLAVQSAGRTFQPTAVVVDAGTVSVSSPGLKTITGLSTVLSPGLYVASVNVNVNCTLVAFVGLPFTGVSVNNSAWTSNPGLYYLRTTSQSLGGGAFPATPVGWNDPGSSGVSDSVSLHVAGQFSA